MRRATAALAAALVMGGANAALVSHGTTVVDTTSGLEWSQFTPTIGLTFAQVSAELAPGGALAGWELAISSQVQQLAVELGFPICEDCDGHFNAQWASFSQLFGATTTPATNVWAITGDRVPFDLTMHPLFHFSSQAVVDEIVATPGMWGYEGFGDGQLVFGTTPVGLPDDGMVYNIRVGGEAVAAAGAFLVRTASRDALADPPAVSAVPEPSTYGLMLAGLAVGMFMTRRGRLAQGGARIQRRGL
jgi:hypothetical protein